MCIPKEDVMPWHTPDTDLACIPKHILRFQPLLDSRALLDAKYLKSKYLGPIDM